MKRFLLFAGDTYYPGGGWDDFRRDFDSVAAAFDAGDKGCLHGANDWDWYQVVDTTTMQEASRPVIDQ